MASEPLSGLLEGRTAVVTGGGRGIGRVVATTLAGAGATVVVTARSVEPLEETAATIRAHGGTAHVIPADLGVTADVERLAARVDELGLDVDVLVNNSGVSGPSAPLWEVDPDDWDATFAVNVRGVYLCCRAFLPGMIARGSGSIVTIGSMTGKRPLLGRSAYGASKTALIGLIRALAHEVGPKGIRVNLVSPGGVDGERIERAIRMLAEQQDISVEDARRQFTDPAALKRLVPPADVANAVLFLASDLAASVTGEDLNASAGVVMY
jgi:NAD(P)-dependent dehydrogenase (short-subunit alcohol dehydrogenase family)